MSKDQGVGVVTILLMMILPAMALIARRPPAGRVARLASVWAIIFLATAAAIALVKH